MSKIKETETREWDDDGEEMASVLLHVPKALYNEYLKILTRKAVKRQRFNSNLFCEVIQKLVDAEK